MSISFAERLAQDRRAFILDALNEATGYQLNDLTLKSVLLGIGHRVSRAAVRTDLEWLERRKLVRVEKLPVEDADADRRTGDDGPTVWLATLTERGQDVVAGEQFPGVARKPPV